MKGLPFYNGWGGMSKRSSQDQITNWPMHGPVVQVERWCQGWKCWLMAILFSLHPPLVARRAWTMNVQAHSGFYTLFSGDAAIRGR